MTESSRRAAAVSALPALVLAAGVREPTVGAVLALGLIAAIGGPFYRVWDRPARGPGTLETAVLVAAVAILATVTGLTDVPLALFAVTVSLVLYGHALLATADPEATPSGTVTGTRCLVGAAVATVVGLLALGLTGRAPLSVAPSLAVLGVAGAVVATLVADRAPPAPGALIVATVAPLLYGLWLVIPAMTAGEAALALAITGGIGYVSVALETASPSGMLAGMLFVLLTIVLGGYGWVALLIAFFAIGGLATKYRYAEKADRGVAERNTGARGARSVLGNAGVALVAVAGYGAAAADLVAVDPTLFVLGFAGALATAMADTLSSEIGSVHDGTRLITTLEPVPAGTDGGITWQGEVAGVAGAGVVALAALGGLSAVSPVGAVAVLLAGATGMTLDSLLGATLEGPVVGNHGVNLLATLGGGLVAPAVGLALL